MRQFKLEEVIPENSEIMINGKVYTLRKITLADEVWLKKFGDLQRLLDAEDADFMSKLTFRLLVDKSDFLPQEIKDYDDDGNCITRMKSGPERILEGMSGASQKFEWLKTLCVCFGISRPLFDEMVDSAMKGKKKVDQDLSPAGERSLT